MVDWDPPSLGLPLLPPPSLANTEPAWPAADLAATEIREDAKLSNTALYKNNYVIVK